MSLFLHHASLAATAAVDALLSVNGMSVSPLSAETSFNSLISLSTFIHHNFQYQLLAFAFSLAGSSSSSVVA